MCFGLEVVSHRSGKRYLGVFFVEDSQIFEGGKEEEGFLTDRMTALSNNFGEIYPEKGNGQR